MEIHIREASRGCTEPVKGKPGTYRIYFSLGKDPETGKYLRSPKRTYHCRSKNPKNWRPELDKALQAYRSELERGGVPQRRPKSVADYAEDFHAMREGTMGSSLAYEREDYDIRHIRELFGDVPLAELRSDDIRRAYAKARKSGRFKETEIRRIHVKLKQILNDAVDNDLISRNPCRGIILPKRTVEARQALSAEMATRFNSCLMDEPLSSYVICTMLLLHCGLRKGEALGLSWEDYDSESRTLHIRKQYTNDKKLRPPKSKMSRRVISVSAVVAERLDQWKTLQREKLEQYALGQVETTPIANGVKVVGSDDGKRVVLTRVEGHNYSRWFRDFCVDNGFGEYEVVTSEFERNGKLHKRGRGYRGLVPHALRHTQATLLIGEGSDVKTVQARLGHASPSTTLAIYAHAIDANDRKAADAISSLLEG